MEKAFSIPMLPDKKIKNRVNNSSWSETVWSHPFGSSDLIITQTHVFKSPPSRFTISLHFNIPYASRFLFIQI